LVIGLLGIERGRCSRRFLRPMRIIGSLWDNISFLVPLVHFWCPVLDRKWASLAAPALERGEWRPKIKFQFSSVQFSKQTNMFSGSLRVNDALYPSKSGLINKHTVNQTKQTYKQTYHTVPIKTYRETWFRGLVGLVGLMPSFGCPLPV